MPDQLKKYRVEIDKIDEELVRLINQRCNMAIEIGKIKKAKNLPLVNRKREEEVIARVKSLTTTAPPDKIEIIWKELIALAVSLEGHTNKIAYFGPEGTFTHQAALQYFPKSNSEFIPELTIRDIFSKVSGGYYDFGIIPIENSSEGSVGDTLDRLIEFDIKIYAELEIKIIQCLIGIEPIQWSEIKKIYSHPQAIAQTSLWRAKNCPNAEIIEIGSTSKCVQKIKELNDKTCVAIGNTLAAKQYGLIELEKGIENITQNYTRFIVISKKEPEPTEKDKTSIVFVVNHEPGSLFNILRIFAENGLNLTKIESRPAKNGLWEYVFICDYEGNVSTTMPILEQVKKSTVWMKILGSYPKGKKY